MLSEFQILITLLCMSADDEDNNTLLLTNIYLCIYGVIL